MNYIDWGNVYLQEAERLRDRVRSLRRKARQEDDSKTDAYSARIALLYSMYLDCLHTGQFLIENGGRR